ncbi:MAG TPA: radical SAM protein [Labilithrix sp.]|nr:radical SAM protein [Labilithrix sp.]
MPSLPIAPHTHAPANVTLVNLNLVRVPAIAPYALDVLGTSLEDAGHSVQILDLTRTDAPFQAIAVHFALDEPDVVALTMRNNFDIYFPSYGNVEADGSFLSSHARVIEKIAEYVPRERIVIGGVGFSTAPHALLERFNLGVGVRGPGDEVLSDIASAMVAGVALDSLPYPKEIRGKRIVFDGRKAPIQRRVRRTYVDNKWYYEYGGLGNIRTSNGCSMRCSYCAEPYAKNAAFTKGAIDDAIFELDQLVEMGIFDVQTADSEFNMPFNHSKAVLRAMIERGYPRELRLWAYGQPSPWDTEYAGLLAKAGVPGVNLGTDHTDPEMLEALHKWFGPDDIVKTTRLCHDNGIAVMHELLFGYPGDTPDKMFRAIEFLLKLEPRVIGVTIGMGVLEGTPLGDSLQQRIARGADLSGFYFKGQPFVDPTYYVDPSFEIPEIYEQLNRFVGTELHRVMIPKWGQSGDSDNQLVNSKRVAAQLLEQKKKGAYWFHYGS